MDNPFAALSSVVLVDRALGEVLQEISEIARAACPVRTRPRSHWCAVTAPGPRRAREP